ncbi:MAG: LysR family transcriptional regulator [Burkholderiaceae bacterium]|nr:MAG: LysR family transcriptional regulator [Burkholderiaceae bacterium]
MNLHLLRTFVAVAEHGSFTRAAEVIHVSQPAVSRAVRELEEQLGLPLVERFAGQVRCTEAGAALLRHAGAIFALERTAESDLRARRGLKQGRLMVAGSRTIATYRLPPRVARFLDAHPHGPVRMVSDNSHSIEQRLLAYELDMALVEAPLHDPRIELLEWRDDQMAIVASAARFHGTRSPLSAERFSSMRWIMRETGSGTREIAINRLREAGVEISDMLEVDGNAAVVASVAAGLGVTMISLEAARDPLALGRLVKLELAGLRTVRPLYRARMRERPMSPAALAFDRLVQETGREDPAVAGIQAAAAPT